MTAPSTRFAPRPTGTGSRMDRQTLRAGSVVSFEYDAPASFDRPSTWRSELCEVLVAFGGLERPDDVVVVAGELVSNGVEHGGGVERLHVSGSPDHVLVEVRDRRASMGAPHPLAAHADRGRGLEIVNRLADSWGWRPEPGEAAGKTVWARFATAPEDGA